MKSLTEYIQEQKHNFIIGKKLDSSIKSSNIVIAEDKDHLKKIIKETTTKLGFECDLNFIDVSNVTDMSNLFARSRFNGDISRWDVSNIEDMYCMFYYSIFNKDISNWNVSNVKIMLWMFANSKFNGDISSWKINKNCNILCMFDNCQIKEEFKPKLLQLR